MDWDMQQQEKVEAAFDSLRRVYLEVYDGESDKFANIIHKIHRRYADRRIRTVSGVMKALSRFKKPLKRARSRRAAEGVTEGITKSVAEGVTEGAGVAADNIAITNPDEDRLSQERSKRAKEMQQMVKTLLLSSGEIHPVAQQSLHNIGELLGGVYAHSPKFEAASEGESMSYGFDANVYGSLPLPPLLSQRRL